MYLFSILKFAIALKSKSCMVVGLETPNCLELASSVLSNSTKAHFFSVFRAIEVYKLTDATINPSLILSAAQQQKWRNFCFSNLHVQKQKKYYLKSSSFEINAIFKTSHSM